MASPVKAKLYVDHVQKLYERCPKNMADAQHIAGMWAKVSGDREMDDPRAHLGQVPPPAGSAGPASGGPTATGGIAGPQQAAAAPPPHSPGEGSTSSGSGTPAAAPTPAVGVSQPAQANASTGKPPKKARRTQSAAPTVGRKEGLQEPPELVFADGHCPSNTRLLAEWQAYLDALVTDNLIMQPADAACYMATLRAGVDNGTAVLAAQRIEEERVHNWNLQYVAMHPIPRPDNGSTPVRSRLTPFEAKPSAPPADPQ